MPSRDGAIANGFSNGTGRIGTTGGRDSAIPQRTTDGDGNRVGRRPYGLSALWKGGDLIARGALAVLLSMSRGS